MKLFGEGPFPTDFAKCPIVPLEKLTYIYGQ